MEFDGQNIKHIETTEVKEGVVCDVYEFEDDKAKDLAIVKVSKGSKTPLQKVIAGDKTVEIFREGVGKLSVTDLKGVTQVYEFPGQYSEIEVMLGEQMQWEAIEDLVFAEVCYPPYQDGRFEEEVVPNMKNQLQHVPTFWFEELSFEDKFSGKPEIDAAIAERFSDTHAAVAAGEFWQERNSAKAYLAEVIVLDQFSRQLFRDSAWAYAYDGQALTLAQEAINRGLDTELEPGERMFLYMPFMHSESKVIHEATVPLFESPYSPRLCRGVSASESLKT